MFQGLLGHLDDAVLDINSQGLLNAGLRTRQCPEPTEAVKDDRRSEPERSLKENAVLTSGKNLL
jgi:hypothetical protein